MRTTRSTTSERNDHETLHGFGQGAVGAVRGFGSWAWVLAAAPIALALALVVAFSVGNAANAPEQTVYPGIRSLSVDTDHGNVEIVGAAVTDVRVTRRHHGDAPRGESSGGGSLAVGLLCDEGFVCTTIRDTPRDRTDYAFVVPAGIDVTVHSRNGDVVLRGLTGKVVTRPGNGSITRQDGQDTRRAQDAQGGQND
ncbi:hypothetical protein AB0F88_34935 [Streptosporangium sp. NPDC023963]|uniref:hypothetical protein n=1 Tax=Streptosporangium sp. NPDC023963 TaxID=3155608 RepID=UPI00342D9484